VGGSMAVSLHRSGPWPACRYVIRRPRSCARHRPRRECRGLGEVVREHERRERAARVRTYPDSVEAGLMNSVPVFARTGTLASLELSVPHRPPERAMTRRTTANDAPSSIVTIPFAEVRPGREAAAVPNGGVRGLADRPPLDDGGAGSGRPSSPRASPSAFAAARRRGCPTRGSVPRQLGIERGIAARAWHRGARVDRRVPSTSMPPPAVRRRTPLPPGSGELSPPAKRGRRSRHVLARDARPTGRPPASIERARVAGRAAGHAAETGRAEARGQGRRSDVVSVGSRSRRATVPTAADSQAPVGVGGVR
jgi:hypothetical protein